MQFKAQVTLAGPDGDRGVRFLKGGLVQTLTMASYCADYVWNPIVFGENPCVYRPSEMEGMTYLDTGFKEEGDATRYLPYYSQGFDGRNGDVAIIQSHDTPALTFPVYYSPPNTFYGDGSLCYVGLEVDFHDYVVVENLGSAGRDRPEWSRPSGRHQEAVYVSRRRDVAIPRLGRHGWSGTTLQSVG